MPNNLHTTSVLEFFSLKTAHCPVEKPRVYLYYLALRHLVTLFYE